MSAFVFTGLVTLVAVAAGFVGSLTGLGGGVIIVPLLILCFGVDIRYAAGASLLSVIATSSGAAAAYVKEGYSNIRIAMFLEIATTTGALVGASLAARLNASWIAMVFGFVLVGSAWLTVRGHGSQRIAPTGDQRPSPSRLRLDSSYPSAHGPRPYHVQRVPWGFSVMFLAGGLSGLLGIGSGALKVIGMDGVMRVPFKVSTTTSNFMIGVTAAASAGVYVSRGYLDPRLALPVVLGVLPGALVGATVLPRIRAWKLRKAFSVVVLLLSVEMFYKGIRGGL